jgi:hypothetical protein
VKFVIADAPISYAKDVAARYQLHGRVAATLFSPVFGELEPDEPRDGFSRITCRAAPDPGAQLCLESRDARRVMPPLPSSCSRRSRFGHGSALARRDGYSRRTA